MKTLLTLVLASAALFLLTAFVPASFTDQDQEPITDVQHDEPSVLQLAMQTLGQSIGQVHKLSTDPKSKELMPLLVQAEEAAMSVLANPPEAPEKLKGKELALWKISYRQEALGLAQDVLNLQVAVVNQDAEAIRKALLVLKERENSGHTKFG